MSNQTLLWASFVLFWLSLIFLKKEEIRRYMPVALFGGLISTIVIEMGITLHWWATIETVFPLVNMPIFNYGAYFVGIIWIFRFTYGHFWLFFASNLIIDSILIFFLTTWFIRRGIVEIYDITNFQMLAMATIQALLLYGYQMWQEGEASLETLPSLQPAANKPLNEELSDKPDKQ
jgi:hypothetical protein